MKLALECPNYLLKDIQPLVDFDWILTHLVLQDEVYAKHYRDSKNFKVLDNSVNELLEPCSLGEMERAVEYVKPDLIVPPDFLGDSLETESTLLKALHFWPKEKILPCIQGEDRGHAIDCARCIKELGFNRLAVPYDITCSRTDSREIMAGARVQVVKIVTEMSLEVHLLGFTTLEELGEYQDNPWIKSIDTGVPILYGMNLKHLDEPWDFKKDKPTMSQMDPYLEDFQLSASGKLSAIFWNIAYLRKVISGT